MIYFFSDDTTNFVTAKRQGMDAEREKKNVFHTNFKLLDYPPRKQNPRLAKIGQNRSKFSRFRRNDEHLTYFGFFKIKTKHTQARIDYIKRLPYYFSISYGWLSR